MRKTFLVPPGGPEEDRAAHRSFECHAGSTKLSGGELVRKKVMHLGPVAGPWTREGEPRCSWEAQGLLRGFRLLALEGHPGRSS